MAERKKPNRSGFVSLYESGFENASYDYAYPNDLELKPGTDQHDFLRDRLWDRAQESFRIMGDRHVKWKGIDEVLRAYVAPETKEKTDWDYNEDEHMPKIVMPVSYANLETLLTYFTAAFLQDPIFKYEGSGPEDVLGAMLMELVVDRQCKRNGAGLALHTMWRDGLAYGVGAVAVQWERRFGPRVVRKQTGLLDAVRAAFRVTSERKEIEENALLFEGNKLVNIDPYRFLPDPNVAAHSVQDGEYVGWIEASNYADLIGQERDEESPLFNVKWLRHMRDCRSSLGRYDPSLGDRRGPTQATQHNKPVDIVWMYVNLIPEEWDLGDGEYPEKWVFGLAGDQVIVAAEPLGLLHNMFPVAVCAPDYDGYSSVPVSRMEIIHDMQTMVDFYYTSRVMNVRKAVNDMLVVDPQMVNIHDLNNPKPGKLIRLRRSAWGRAGAVKDSVSQLDVRDVTQNHVSDVTYLNDFANKVTGATDSVQGIVHRRGPRVSASEATGARQSSLSRLEKTARIVSMQAHMPIAYMFASHVQQLMEADTYVKVVGDTERVLRQDLGQDVKNGRMSVHPMDLVVDYDLVEHDGTIPGSQDVGTWVDLFSVMGQNPILAQHFDIPRLFKHIARHMGAKNVDDFVLSTPKVVDDETVMREVERGNLVNANSNGTMV